MNGSLYRCQTCHAWHTQGASHQGSTSESEWFSCGKGELALWTMWILKTSRFTWAGCHDLRLHLQSEQQECLPVSPGRSDWYAAWLHYFTLIHDFLFNNSPNLSPNLSNALSWSWQNSKEQKAKENVCFVWSVLGTAHCGRAPHQWSWWEKGCEAGWTQPVPPLSCFCKFSWHNIAIAILPIVIPFLPISELEWKPESRCLNRLTMALLKINWTK